MMDITSKNLSAEILRKPNAVVDFWAEWCHPCMNFKPIFEKVANDFPGVAFGKINVESDQELARDFDVMSIPTILFFKAGKEVDRFIGTLPEDALKQRITVFLE